MLAPAPPLFLLLIYTAICAYIYTFFFRSSQFFSPPRSSPRNNVFSPLAPSVIAHWTALYLPGFIHGAMFCGDIVFWDAIIELCLDRVALEASK
jgi:hypothetical protein